MIIVGTALMATAINSVFDMSGMVTGGFSGIAILVKRVDGGSRAGRHPAVDHKLKSEYPTVSDRNEAQWIPVCEKGHWWEKSACHSGWRFFRHLTLQEMIFCWQPFMVV